MKMPDHITDGPHHPDFYADDVDPEQEAMVQAKLEDIAKNDLRTLDGKLYDYLLDCDPGDLARLCEAVIVNRWGVGLGSTDRTTALIKTMSRDFYHYRTSSASQAERDEIAEGL